MRNAVCSVSLDLFVPLIAWPRSVGFSGGVQCEMLCPVSGLTVLQVLFEKLRLQERCENKKLPKTVLKQQRSTSEAAVRARPLQI